MKKIEFIPIDYDYFDYQGKNYARIVGRMKDGKKACLIDGCDVYFWAILKDGVSEKKIRDLVKKIEKIKVSGKGRESEVSKAEVYDKKFLGKEVRAIKIYITNYKDSKDIADKLGYKEIYKRREYDLSYITKYILERKMRPLVWYEVEGELLNNSLEFGGIDNSLDVDVCINVDNIKELDVGDGWKDEWDGKDSKNDKNDYKPKILAYDIETDEFEIGKDKITMISLVGEGYKKVLTWKKSKKSFVKTYKDEGEMIKGFVSEVKEYDPDILVGYFSDGFDMPYLRARAEKNKIRLNLGVDNSQPSFSRGRLLTAKIKGIVHVDLFRFIRTTYSQYLQSETLSLNDVAFELLGEKKDEWEFKHSSKIKENEWEKYFEYNLKDSVLTYKLMEKMLPDMLEFTKIIQEPLFDVSRDGMSAQVENYLIHNMDKYDEIIEKRPYNDEIGKRRANERYEGAFVLQPIPGLYEDIVFFDFTSMYGSIIVSYNLSKSTYLEKKEKGSKMVDIGKKVYFSKDKGFFSEMLKEMIGKRKKYKVEYNKNPDPIVKARSNAFKLLVNAAYGYQGFFGARYYCIEAAAATAALARESIKETISFIEKEGYKIVYADTDSIAFLREKKTKKEINDLLKKINDKLPGIMELDLEGFFKRGIWVTKRTGDAGAKKKYALIDEKDKIKIRGFETVRRDWCNLARETQNKVLDLILRNGNEKKAVEYVKDIIKKIKKRDVDFNKLVIKTQLKKPIEEYKSISPHVAIAKKMMDGGLRVSIGMLIEYYIAEPIGDKKRSLIRERARLPGDKGEYDIEYYLNNQILPAVENIFEVFKVDVRGLLDGERQKGLGDF